MIGPTWVAALFGVLMVGAAAASAGRIVVAIRSHRPTDFPVDGCHLLMGVAMGGMLLPGLRIADPGVGSDIWLVVWILVAAWFAVGLIRPLLPRARPGSMPRHRGPHLVFALAMVYMFVVLAVARPGAGSAGMAGMGASSAIPLPTVDVALAVFMVGYAVLVIDRPLTVGAPAPTSVGAGTAAGTDVEPLVLAPRLGSAIVLVMAVTMAYMLVMMFV